MMMGPPEDPIRLPMMPSFLVNLFTHHSCHGALHTRGAGYITGPGVHHRRIPSALTSPVLSLF
jgi:hypothetical protein